MTRILVLGMLDNQPMSGYDIQQMLKLTAADRWGGVLIGSIYHALKKLEQEEHIEIISIEHTGNRQKAIYQITQRGKDHLKDLLSEALRVSSVSYPSALYSGLTFMNLLTNEQACKALEHQQLLLEEEYRFNMQGLEEKKAAMGGLLPPLVQLMFDNMFAIVRQQQDFINSALDLIRQK